MSYSKNVLKSGHILIIMNDIEDDYIESALKRLNYGNTGRIDCVNAVQRKSAKKQVTGIIYIGLKRHI